MQKKLIALAVAALAGSAFAQTNVTIYGIADVGAINFNYEGTRKSDFKIDSGILSTSRLGFRGTEDLGNGLKALFTLEYGLAVDANTGVGTGSAAARQQFVGLTGGFGTALAGRLQTTGLDFRVASSPLGASSVLGAANAANIGTLVSHVGRADNAFAYVSPSFGGLTLAYNHARLTENASAEAALKNGSANLVSASYANGPISAGAVYSKMSNANTLASDNRTEMGIRGGYNFGVANLQAAYQTNKVQGSNKDKQYVVAVTVPVSAALAIVGEYSKNTINSTVAADNVKAYTLAATYALSKRTTAYAGVAAKNTTGTNTNDYTALAAGVRHSF